MEPVELFLGFLVTATIVWLILLWGACKIVRPRRARPEGSSWLHSTTPEGYGLTNYTPFFVTTPENLTIQGWILYSTAGRAKGTILFVHGFASCKEYLLPIAQHFVRAGFHAVLFDSRAQGRSGGSYCTFGAREVEDIQLILDELERRDLGPFAIIGHSLGGAIALQVLAREPRLVCGIIKGAFASLPEIVQYHLQRDYRIASPIIARLFLRCAGALAEFDPFTIQPGKTARNVYQPVLVIHGTEDIEIPIEHGRRIYAALASNEKEFYEIIGGGHFGLEQVAGKEYFKRQIAFLQHHLDRVQKEGVSHGVLVRTESGKNQFASEDFR